MTWDPHQYGRFAGPRQRPALELLARVDHDDPAGVVDVGCGRGEMARLMADRWPEAQITGFDTSEAMLTEAAAVSSRVVWELQDVRKWAPAEPVDVIYSNAVFHWVEDHDSLFPRLASYLAPGGSLAAQMPLNWTEPSHQILRETLDDLPFGPPELREFYGRRPVGEPEDYYDRLAPLVSSLDIWTTRYAQVLEGADPVLEWVKGSVLVPLIDALDKPDLDRFMGEYARRLRLAYPQRAGGETLFPFTRLFIVARSPLVRAT